VKYLKDDKIIIGVGSIVQVWGRRVTGARCVRPTLLVLVPDNKGGRVLVVQGRAPGLERFRNLGRDVREAIHNLEKSKLVYLSKVYRKHHSGLANSLLQQKGVIVIEGLEAPFLVLRHVSFTNLPSLEHHDRPGQTEGGDPCRIPPATHLANLVNPAL
jgi:hypothetical protein